MNLSHVIEICYGGLSENFHKENLNVALVAAVFVPRARDARSKTAASYAFLEMSDRSQTFISRIICRDEIWGYDHYPETKQ